MELTEQQIIHLATELSTDSKAELRKQLFKLKKEGINLYDLSCAFLFGKEEFRNYKVGYYILDKMHMGSEYEKEYCKFFGIGTRKQCRQTCMLLGFDNLLNNFYQEDLFQSKYTLTPRSLTDIARTTQFKIELDHYRKQKIQAIEFKQEKQESEKRYNKYGFVLDIILIFLPLIVALVPYWYVYMNFGSCVACNIAAIAMPIWYFILLFACAKAYGHPVFSRYTSFLLGIIIYKREPWIITAIIWGVGLLSLYKYSSLALCLLYLIGLFVGIGYLAQQHIFASASKSSEWNESPGVAAGAVGCVLLTFVGLAVLFIIAIVKIVSNFNYFLN